MTSPQETTPSVNPPPSVPTTTSAPIPVVVPPENTRLDQLMAELDGAKKAKKDAETREKEVTDAIKVEALRLAPEGAAEVIIRSRWASLPWKLSARDVWRLGKKFKEEMPELWMHYANKTVEWRLDPMK